MICIKKCMIVVLLVIHSYVFSADIIKVWVDQRTGKIADIKEAFDFIVENQNDTLACSMKLHAIDRGIRQLRKLHHQNTGTGEHLRKLVQELLLFRDLPGKLWPQEMLTSDIAKRECVSALMGLRKFDGDVKILSAKFIYAFSRKAIFVEDINSYTPNNRMNGFSLYIHTLLLDKTNNVSEKYIKKIIKYLIKNRIQLSQDAYGLMEEFIKKPVEPKKTRSLSEFWQDFNTNIMLPLA